MVHAWQMSAVPCLEEIEGGVGRGGAEAGAGDSEVSGVRCVREMRDR